MKFLVIQTRDIGDVMLSTALCNTLKKNYSAATVDMLTMDFSTGVVEGNPFMMRFWCWKKIGVMIYVMYSNPSVLFVKKNTMSYSTYRGRLLA